jgi:adenosylcobinamide-GDP ribazoletransferase
VIAALFAGQVVSRLAPLLLARSLHGDVPARSVQVGALWCALPLLLLLAAAGVGALALAVVAATLACYGLWRLGRRQASPVDRDFLAAAQQVCEVAFYLGAAVGL